MEHIVGIGEYAISDNEKDIIKTFSLGTCVGLVIYAKTKKVMGMAHIALPDSNVSNDDVVFFPARYADKAVDILINEMRNRYACIEGDLEAAVIGGFNGINNDNNSFRIGERNLDAVKDKLDKLGLKYILKETGGYSSRNVTAHVRTGEVDIVSYPMSL